MDLNPRFANTPILRQVWRHADSLSRIRNIAVFASLFDLGLPIPAQAHVKWFAITDVHAAPVAATKVISSTFLGILCVASLLVLLGFMLDSWIARRWPRIVSSGMSYGAIEERLIRVAAGAYFVCISDTGGVILTPELTSNASWLGMIQFAIAFFLIWRPTCVLAGIGILALFAYAVYEYGIFHLTDYFFFPCLAFYLTSLSVPGWRLCRAREPVLVGGLAFSLAWTSIEKFVYPQWTDAVIATHPGIAFGLPDSLVVVIAGFVEFTLSFYLVVGRGLLRLGGGAFAVIFMAAMPPFGRLDVFGHLVIIAVLCIVVLRGTTPMQNGLHLAGRSLALDVGWVLLLYLASLGVFIALYYGLQATCSDSLLPICGVDRGPSIPHSFISLP